MKKNLPRNSTIRFWLALFALSSACLISGCTGNGKQPDKIATPAGAVAPKVLPAPQLQISSAVSGNNAAEMHFDFSSKKDPFKPFVETKPSPPPAAARTERKASLPIHSYDVRQFKLIGVVTDGENSRAMVTDPSGKGYVLRIGSIIGRNEGRVSTIARSRVEIVEQSKDDKGRVRKKRISITLPRKE